MLDKDIMRGTGDGLAHLLYTTRAAARGAAVFGLLAGAVAVAAIIGAGIAAGGVAAMGWGLMADAAVGSWMWAAGGAAVGAAAMTVAAQMPGSDEGYTFQRLFKRSKPEPLASRSVQQEQPLHRPFAPETAAGSPEAADNYYYREGLGAELLEKSRAMSQQQPGQARR